MYHCGCVEYGKSFNVILAEEGEEKEEGRHESHACLALCGRMLP
jgi:hypothetical protein